MTFISEKNQGARAYTRGKERTEVTGQKGRDVSISEAPVKRNTTVKFEIWNERYRFLLQRRHVEADIGGCSDRSSTGRLVDEL